MEEILPVQFPQQGIQPGAQLDVQPQPGAQLDVQRQPGAQLDMQRQPGAQLDTMEPSQRKKNFPLALHVPDNYLKIPSPAVCFLPSFLLDLII